MLIFVENSKRSRGISVGNSNFTKNYKNNKIDTITMGDLQSFLHDNLNIS